MRSCINKSMKVYAEYDANILKVKEFAKLWIKGKISNIFPKEFKIISSKKGFAGSGSWVYEYDGDYFSINGVANGKGFWGTDYSISLIEKK